MSAQRTTFNITLPSNSCVTLRYRRCSLSAENMTKSTTRRNDYARRSNVVTSNSSMYSDRLDRPIPLPRANTMPMIDDRSYHAPSSVSGYRRHMAVEGLPGSTFFEDGDGASHRHRGHERSSHNRHEPRGRSHRRARSPSNSDRYNTSKALIVRRDSVTGRELVRYSGSQDFDDDEETVVPEDSISQVSSNPSHRSRRSRYSHRSGRSDDHHRRSGEADSRYESRYRYDPSAYESRREYDSDHRAYIIERRPRR